VPLGRTPPPLIFVMQMGDKRTMGEDREHRKEQSSQVPAPSTRGAPAIRPVGSLAIGATAVGALALGAIAVGALAIGKLAVGQLAIRGAKLRRGKVGELRISQLIVEELHVVRIRGRQ
jgi:hypothetical protein